MNHPNPMIEAVDEDSSPVAFSVFAVVAWRRPITNYVTGRRVLEVYVSGLRKPIVFDGDAEQVEYQIRGRLNAYYVGATAAPPPIAAEGTES